MTTPLVTLGVDSAALDQLAALLAGRLGDLFGERDKSPWMTAAAAADYLSLSMDALYRLTAAVAIPHRKLNNRLLFRRAELDTWLDDQYCGPARRT